jgi:hypothetical protein
MAVDVLTYPELISAEAQLLAYESSRDIGKFSYGDDQSLKIGDGLEIDGLRDYQPGDEARHIDWIASAKLADGGLVIRQHYAEQSPLTVVISDIPTDGRYAETPGLPLSARGLGFVVAHSVLKAGVKSGAPIFGIWTDGFELGKKPKVYEGPKAPRLAINSGLEIAGRSTNLAHSQEAPQKRSGLLRRKVEQAELPKLEAFSEVIERTKRQTRLIADTARFIIISDFRVDVEGTCDALRGLSRSSDVVAVQITNPYLRELPAGVTTFSTGAKGVIIESDQQRIAYARKAFDKQARINASLKNVTTKAYIVDTMTPKVATLA